jgi:hypothetical protein
MNRFLASAAVLTLVASPALAGTTKTHAPKHAKVVKHAKVAKTAPKK